MSSMRNIREFTVLPDGEDIIISVKQRHFVDPSEIGEFKQVQELDLYQLEFNCNELDAKKPMLDKVIRQSAQLFKSCSLLKKAMMIGDEEAKRLHEAVMEPVGDRSLVHG